MSFLNLSGRFIFEYSYVNDDIDQNPSKIVLDNWLLNPTGNPDSWVELDLVQEHLNYWIKVTIYHLLSFNKILTSQF